MPLSQRSKSIIHHRSAMMAAASIAAPSEQMAALLTGEFRV
jgi:hypothetical protein